MTAPRWNFDDDEAPLTEDRIREIVREELAASANVVKRDALRTLADIVTASIPARENRP